MFYRWMSEEELIERNPAAHLKRPRVDQESMTRSLSRDEAMRLVWTAEASGRPSEQALVTMLAHLGLRVSEAIGVRIEDLGEERGHRTVRIMGKGEKPAIMPMPPAVSRAVELARAGRDSGNLILDTHGNPMNRHSAHFVVAKLARKAGIVGHVHPHCLRHAAITCALDAGVPLRDVQHMARHADPRTTSRYDHGRLSLDRHAAYTLSAYLAGGG
jgi:site-specific recombinase XerD